MGTLEIIVGIVLILVGILLLAFRRSFARFVHRRLKSIYGNGFADAVTNPVRDPTTIAVCGILFILVGASTIVRAVVF